MKENTCVTLGLVQTKMGPNMSDNLANAYRLASEATKKGATIICLPELYNTVYFPQYEHVDKDALAETIPGISTVKFQELAKAHGVVVIIPLYEKVKNKNGSWKYFNSAAVINEKGMLLPTYRKIHIPHDPGFYEKAYFAESDSGYRIYKTPFATFAVLICFDQWFPEAARAARLFGAEIIFYPTAIGDIIGYNAEGDWHEAWQTMMRGHAIANSVHVAAINRTGTEGRMRFFGQSFVSDPFGRILSKAGKSREEVLVVPIDLTRNTFFSEGWGFLRNRRPDTYGLLTSNKLVKKSKKLQNVAHYKEMKKALESISE